MRIKTERKRDGFCLWDSAYTEYDVAASPVKTDVVGAVAKACRKYGVELGLYYSLWDRNHLKGRVPDPTGYRQYMFNQLEELMTQYGDICELWLDGGWVKKNEDWDIPGLYKHVRALQAGCAVTVNHTIHKEGDPIRYWPVDMRLKDPSLAQWDHPQLYTRDGQLQRLPFEHTICLSDRWNWFQKKEAGIFTWLRLCFASSPALQALSFCKGLA